MNGTGERPRVLVLGGRGFIGRHVVAALVATGADVLIGSRRPMEKKEGSCHRRQARMDRLLDPDAWPALLDGCDVVVNCVGILRPRGHETYERVHHLGPAALAEACRRSGTRLIHVSALGLQESVRSGFLLSKRAGEAAIKACGGDWHIVRPSLLDGERGFGARWIRCVAGWPIHPVPRGATGRIAVLDVVDLGEAIATLALAPAASSAAACAREHELGGLHVRTLAEHFAAMRALHSRRPAIRVPIPDLLARAAAHICDLLHWTPLSYGHWELLRSDNCPRINRLPALLGHAPRTVGVLSSPSPGNGLSEWHQTSL